MTPRTSVVWSFTFSLARVVPNWLMTPPNLSRVEIHLQPFGLCDFKRNYAQLEVN